MTASEAVIPSKLKVVASDQEAWDRYVLFLKETKGERYAELVKTEGPPVFGRDMIVKVRANGATADLAVLKMKGSKLTLVPVHEVDKIPYLTAGDRVMCKGVDWKVLDRGNRKLVLQLAPVPMPSLHRLSIVTPDGIPLLEVLGRTEEECARRAEFLDAMVEDAGRLPSEFMRRGGVMGMMLCTVALAEDEVTDEVKAKAKELADFLKGYFGDDLAAGTADPGAGIAKVVTPEAANDGGAPA